MFQIICMDITIVDEPIDLYYRTALLHYVDIVAIPRTHIIKELVR